MGCIPASPSTPQKRSSFTRDDGGGGEIRPRWVSTSISEPRLETVDRRRSNATIKKAKIANAVLVATGIARAGNPDMIDIQIKIKVDLVKLLKACLPLLLLLIK